MSATINNDNHEIRAWSSIIPAENPFNIVSFNENPIYDEQDEEPTEARAWSSYRMMNNENILGEGPSEHHQKVFLSKKSKEDQRGVERVLSYIDQRRRPRQKKYRLTWRTFLGTMAGTEQIYARDDFLKYFEEFQPLFIFSDSVFRGIGQVMFCNSPISGIIITIGLFIGNWELSLYGLLGTCISTLTAHIFGFNYNSIRAGLFGYNGCLTGMGISYFSFSHSPQMIGPVVIMSIFSTIFAMAIGKILVQKLELSPFTFSFQICVWTWLLGALRYRYFFIDGTILSPHLLTTLINKPLLSNVTYAEYTVKDNFVGFFTSISQVYFIENPYTGAIILVGVCICSRILSFFALFGAVTSQLSAAYLLGLPSSAIHSGLWGFNSVLTCQALGGMFFVLYGYRIWLFTLYGSIMTVLVQAGVSSFLSPIGMPTLTFPFTIICWIFCLIAGSKELIAVKLTSVSIPEDHYRRYRLSRSIKSQFKFINQLINPTSSYDEDITWEELSKIQKTFVPVLMCSYVSHNNLHQLKNLVKQNINIHSIDQNLRSPLHISTSQGNIKITKYLIEHLKLNINLVDKFGGTPLFDALWNGHFHLLTYLYSHGGRLPVAKAKEIAYYLNASVYEDNLEAIQCIISCGFNPNGSDYDGQNALHIAVINNKFDIVRYLVEQFPTWLDVKDYYRQTAINYALRLSDLTIAKYLLNKIKENPIPEILFMENSTLLQVVVEKNIQNKNYIKEDEKIEAVSTTLEERLLPTLFGMIVAQEDIQLMENFLKEHPNFNAIEAVDYDFRSAAHIAAAEGRLESIKFLSNLCQNSDFQRIMNREDRWGLSPLDEAYKNGHINITNFVKETIQTKISLSTEISNQNNSIINLFRKWKKILTFSTLAASGQAERIESLFDRGYFIPTEIYADYQGRNPVHFAAGNGHLNVIQSLVKYGYQGILYPNRLGYYPIDEAKQKNFYHIVDYLLQIQL